MFCRLKRHSLIIIIWGHSIIQNVPTHWLFVHIICPIVQRVIEHRQTILWWTLSKSRLINRDFIYSEILNLTFQFLLTHTRIHIPKSSFFLRWGLNDRLQVILTESLKMRLFNRLFIFAQRNYQWIVYVCGLIDWLVTDIYVILSPLFQVLLMVIDEMSGPNFLLVKLNQQIAW